MLSLQFCSYVQSEWYEFSTSAVIKYLEFGSGALVLFFSKLWIARLIICTHFCMTWCPSNMVKVFIFPSNVHYSNNSVSYNDLVFLFC